MRLSLFSCLFMLLPATIFFEINVVLVSGHCLSDQQELLLQLKNKLNFNPSSSLKLAKWNQSLDCCTWEGVTCDATGRVTDLDLSNERISGSMDSSLSKLQSLSVIRLIGNNLSGPFPEKIFQVRTLKTLDLSGNPLLEGSFKEFLPTSSLETLLLSGTSFGGTLPESIRNLGRLSWIELAGCHFNGSIPEAMTNLTQLVYLNFSSNSFSGPIPSFSFATNLTHLNLANNRLTGSIPNWLWNTRSLQYLNLSHNFLVNFQEPMLTTLFFSILDLHDNKLQGQVPKLRSLYLDYSNNNFSSISIDIGDFLLGAMFLSLSNNNLHGIIPESICKLRAFVLDLSNNSLNGSMPQCLILMKPLVVLDLSRNNLSGNIPDAFSSDCSTRALDLNGNRLEGKIPRSLANCTFLEVLDLGNNQINDTFPCHLKNISSLKALVLRSNSFHGQVGCPNDSSSWPLLQIIDLASNHFRGELPYPWLRTWEAMLVRSVKPKIIDVSVGILTTDSYEATFHYQASVTIVNKGSEISLGKILNLFTCIDFSCNNFEGQIPELLGEFRALYSLNLSHNGFKGLIPTSLGNLENLESLDLSSNKLSGEIPQQLGDLNFLAILNLSHNQLEGKIPSGSQFQTFLEDSFKDNKGLCGMPLKKNCSPDVVPTSKDKHSDNGTYIDWNFLSAELGFVFGLGIIILPLMFCKRWRVWYCKRIDGLLSKFFPQLNQRSRNRGRRASKRTKTQLRNKQR